MDWSSISKTVGQYAPLMGTLLGGPAGAAVGTLISKALGTDNDPKAIAAALQQNPELSLKLAQLESDERVRLQELKNQADKAELDAVGKAATDVNTTMQSEAGSEHWPTYSWRPFIGFVFGINLLIAGLTTSAVYICVMCGIVAAVKAMETLPAMIGALGAVNGAALPILGIASWFRGKMQIDPSIPTPTYKRG